MSISRKPEEIILEKKKFLSGRHFNTVVSRVSEKISRDSAAFIFTLMVLITGVKELLGQGYSPFWMILVVIFGCFYLLKLYKKKDEEKRSS